MSVAVTGKWFLNGADLYTTYGLILQEGKSALLTIGERKESLSFSWPEADGTEVDLSAPAFQDYNVTLKMAFLATSQADFNAKRKAFFEELTRPGSHTLTIADHATDYIVYYANSSNFRIGSKRLSGVDLVFVQFDLGLKVQNEYSVDLGTAQPVAIKTESGQVIAMQPPGTTYIVPSIYEASGGDSSDDSQFGNSIGFIGGRA